MLSHCIRSRRRLARFFLAAVAEEDPVGKAERFGSCGCPIPHSEIGGFSVGASRSKVNAALGET